MFKINGKQVAEPKMGGIGVTDEPVWSANTGRVSSGLMKGDIIAWKRTIEVAWPPLSFAQAAEIRNAIKNAGEFFTIEFYDMSTSSTVKPTVYCANIPRVMYSLSKGHQRYTDVSIQFIEQ